MEPARSRRAVPKWWLLEDTGKGTLFMGARPRSWRMRETERNTIPIDIDDDGQITLLTDMEQTYPGITGAVVGRYWREGDEIKYEIVDEAYQWFEKFGR